MFVPEMAYFPVTFCQGFGAKFGRLNNKEAQKSKLFLPLIFLCYIFRKCAPLDLLRITSSTSNQKKKSKIKDKKLYSKTSHFKNNAGFRLTCRLPHCRFDDDISSTAQASLAVEG